MTRLISIIIVLALVVLVGLLQTGASGALPSSPLPISAPARTTTPSLAGTPTPMRTATPTGESTPGTVTAPRAGSRPVSDDNPAAWQASGQTSSPDADPLTEAGRWELFGGGGVVSDIFFVDSAYGWAAGTSVWKTTDGGATWRRPSSLWGAPLRRIIFADRNRGWALGDGLLLRTEDGGATWGVAYVDHWHHEPLLEYQPPNDLWTPQMYTACYDSYCEYFEYFDYLAHSTDGGLTWMDPDPKNPAAIFVNRFEALDFFDRAHGWLVGDYVRNETGICPHGMTKTLDAGQTWTNSCLPVTAEGAAVAISFGSATDGWLSGGATLWRSTDGGANWSQQHTFAAEVNWLQAQDAMRAWVQHGSSIWRTTDGGANWQLLTEAAPARVFFRTTLEGWSAEGTNIAKTTDGGRTWRVIFTLPAARLQEWFWDALTGWRTVGATVEQTTDGGATWQAKNPGLQGIDALKFVDARNGWAWHIESLGLAHTTDGGATWKAQNTGSAALTDLQFVDTDHGWVRDGLQIRRTTDSGQSWHDIPAPPEPVPGRPDTLRLLFIDAMRGWELRTWSEWMGPETYRYESWLSHTTDGGSSWAPLEGVPVDHITFLDRDRGFGWYWHSRDWKISRTEDGGRTWMYVLRGEAYYGPSDLYAADLERLWSPGMAGTVPPGYSSDGGLTWTGQRARGTMVRGRRLVRPHRPRLRPDARYPALVPGHRGDRLSRRSPAADRRQPRRLGPRARLRAQCRARLPRAVDNSHAARRQRHPPGRLGRRQPLLRPARLRRCHQGRQWRQRLAGRRHRDRPRRPPRPCAQLVAG